MGSRVCDLLSCSSRALGHRLSSCGPQAKLLLGTWDLPGLGIKLMSPTLASGPNSWSTREARGTVLNNHDQSSFVKKYLFTWLRWVLIGALVGLGCVMQDFPLRRMGLVASCPPGMRNISSLTRDQTKSPRIARGILDHWTAR